MFSLKLSPEQIEIRRTVRQFAEKEIKPIALARDREEDFDKRFPWHVLAKAEKLGLRTLALSEKNGGGGGSSGDGDAAQSASKPASAEGKAKEKQKAT